MFSSFLYLAVTSSHSITTIFYEGHILKILGGSLIHVLFTVCKAICLHKIWPLFECLEFPLIIFAPSKWIWGWELILNAIQKELKRHILNLLKEANGKPNLAFPRSCHSFTYSKLITALGWNCGCNCFNESETC